MGIHETSTEIMNSTQIAENGNMSAKGLPREMTFNEDNVMSVIAYSCLFIFAASGNLIVLVTLLKSRRYKSRVNTFIMHLSIADLIVAFIMLPLETAWHITVSWQAGDAACRILMFFRAVGFYLSSFVLVTISLDRYFSIVHPMSIHDADRRGKIMLTLAWLLSIIASLPQVRGEI
jgi:gonadotropin-releasing hormone receptor